MTTATTFPKHVCAICVEMRVSVIVCLEIGHICKDCLPHLVAAQNAIDDVNKSKQEKK